MEFLPPLCGTAITAANAAGFEPDFKYGGVQVNSGVKVSSGVEVGSGAKGT